MSFSSSVNSCFDYSSWDSEKGTWLNDKAFCSMKVEDFPDPLYLFVYGSLLWRPGDLLGQLTDRYICNVVGYRRLFAQRSCDHRGTGDFPGLVVTLVEDSYVAQCTSGSSNHCNRRSHTQHKSNVNSDDSRSKCTGMVWLVPRDKAKDIIEELDYRERGGYIRDIVNVYLQEDTPYHKVGDCAQALVYTGLVSNPNFFLPLVDNNIDTSYQNIAIDIIAAAHGKSGNNCDYLFKLVEFMEEHNLYDPYLYNLAMGVKLRLGPWRNRFYNYALNQIHISTSASVTSKSRPPLSPKRCGLMLTTPEKIDLLSTQEEVHTTIDIAGDTSDSHQHEIFGWGSNEYNQLPGLTSGIVCRPRRISENCMSYCQLMDQLVCGGATSGYISTATNCLHMYGSHSKCYNNVVAAAAGHDHLLILLESGYILSIDDDSYKDNALISSMILDDQGCINEEDVNVFNNANTPNINVLKLAAGMRQSACITTDGKLICWGKKAHLSRELDYWQASDGIMLVDVACGHYHTIVIDSLGRLWSVGDNRFGSLGRHVPAGITVSSGCSSKCQVTDNTVQLVTGVDLTVKWQRVVCGWSHSVARGVRKDGSLVFIAWGRCDMGQYPTRKVSNDATVVTSNTADDKNYMIHTLSPLPNGKNINEIWCGSEFTVAADCNGKLYSCGWSEHGNIGNGGTQYCHTSWVPVMYDDDKRHKLTQSMNSNYDGEEKVKQATHAQLSVTWEGSLACGGAHVICFI